MRWLHHPVFAYSKVDTKEGRKKKEQRNELRSTFFLQVGIFFLPRNATEVQSGRTRRDGRASSSPFCLFPLPLCTDARESLGGRGEKCPMHGAQKVRYKRRHLSTRSRRLERGYGCRKASGALLFKRVLLLLHRLFFTQSKSRILQVFRSRCPAPSTCECTISRSTHVHLVHHVLRVLHSRSQTKDTLALDLDNSFLRLGPRFSSSPRSIGQKENQRSTLKSTSSATWAPPRAAGTGPGAWRSRDGAVQGQRRRC